MHTAIVHYCFSFFNFSMRVIVLLTIYNNYGKSNGPNQ